MLQTAENVAKRYDIGRERQDEYGVQSQQRAAAAAAAGKFDDEIVPITVRAGLADKDAGTPLHEGGHARQRRRHPRRHDATKASRRSAPRCPAA